MPDTEVGETMHKLLDLSSDSLIDGDVVLVRKILLAEKEAREDPIAGTGPPSVVTDVGGDPHAKDERVSVIGTQRERERVNDPKPKGNRNVFTKTTRTEANETSAAH